MKTFFSELARRKVWLFGGIYLARSSPNKMHRSPQLLRQRGHLQQWGGIHGGMVAAMLDDLNSIAVGLTLVWGQISPTLEMKTSYIAAARPGTLIGEGWIVKRGKSVAFTEAKLRDPDGTLLATSSSTASFVTLKK